MESQDTSQHECPGCGRIFMQTNAFSYHQRSCKKSKARLSSALVSARENWARRKRARISGPTTGSSGQSDLELTSLPGAPSPAAAAAGSSSTSEIPNRDSDVGIPAPFDDDVEMAAPFDGDVEMAAPFDGDVEMTTPFDTLSGSSSVAILAMPTELNTNVSSKRFSYSVLVSFILFVRLKGISQIP